MARLPLRAARACCLSLMIALAAVPTARAARPTPAPQPDQIQGNWATEDGDGVIAVAPCTDSAALCGRIVGIRHPPGAPVPPRCGMVILRNQRPAEDGSWRGNVLDPRSGRTFGAQMWLDDAGNLRVRGFLISPLLGQTQIWHRYAGQLGSDCTMS
jgi:uncharacterized protein (DUF2147 family)